MTDRLLTFVEDCVTEDYGTQLTLRSLDQTNIGFKLPFPVYLKRDDEIIFQDGELMTGDAGRVHIDHTNHLRAEVFRGGEPFLSFQARQIRVLSELRDAEEEGGYRVTGIPKLWKGEGKVS